MDDEESLRETVGFALRREGHRVELFADGLEAWRSFERGLPDLVVLDILMPRMDGRELCRRLRALSERLPFLFLTSSDEEFDRVLGLELGADDYLCKPFSMRELRGPREGAAAPGRLPGGAPLGERRAHPEVGRLRLDLRRYQAYWDGAPGSHRDRVHPPPRPGPPPRPREDPRPAHGGGLPHDAYVCERTIDSHVKRLRQKLVDVDPLSTASRPSTVGYRYRQGH